MGPIATLKQAQRIALRKRYGYAALRAMRVGLRKAVAKHKVAQLTPGGNYATSNGEVAYAYWSALKRIRQKYPRLDLEDVRAKPDLG